MTFDIVGVQRLLNPLHIEFHKPARRLASPTRIPLLIGVDHQIDRVAYFRSHSGDAAHIITKIIQSDLHFKRLIPLPDKLGGFAPQLIF